MRYLVLLELA